MGAASGTGVGASKRTCMQCAEATSPCMQHSWPLWLRLCASWPSGAVASLLATAAPMMFGPACRLAFPISWQSQHRPADYLEAVGSCARRRALKSLMAWAVDLHLCACRFPLGAAWGPESSYPGPWLQPAVSNTSQARRQPSHSLHRSSLAPFLAHPQHQIAHSPPVALPIGLPGADTGSMFQKLCKSCV